MNKSDKGNNESNWLRVGIALLGAGAAIVAAIIGGVKVYNVINPSPTPGVQLSTPAPGQTIIPSTPAPTLPPLKGTLISSLTPTGGATPETGLSADNGTTYQHSIWFTSDTRHYDSTINS